MADTELDIDNLIQRLLEGRLKVKRIHTYTLISLLRCITMTIV